ncbi:hypothetical protein AVEN_209325-1 [Araneus ventricosus]|uniref:Uncharacterized protein n=1 Tax=Araneus ventricosus TaxID=182803 RepID=A0A4Y2CB78_ARAVE|nr:hypothetical protein AVEN_209325-1 [Araneus ventricosus]
MGNLIAEENGESPLLEVSYGTETTFFINLILTEIQFKCHIALAPAPSSIPNRLLDDDSIAHSSLQLSLVLNTLRILHAIQAESLIRRLSNKLKTSHLGCVYNDR